MRQKLARGDKDAQLTKLQPEAAFRESYRIVGEIQITHEGVLPTIPLRALIPKGSRNLLVAGRSVSSDRLANSALRVQAPCMAMGQAAGAAAALAAQRDITPLDVPFPDLVQLLQQHDAIVPRTP